MYFGVVTNLLAIWHWLWINLIQQWFKLIRTILYPFTPSFPPTSLGICLVLCHSIWLRSFVFISTAKVRPDWVSSLLPHSTFRLLLHLWLLPLLQRLFLLLLKGFWEVLSNLKVRISQSLCTGGSFLWIPHQHISYQLNCFWACICYQVFERSCFLKDKHMLTWFHLNHGK